MPTKTESLKKMNLDKWVDPTHREKVEECKRDYREELLDTAELAREMKRVDEKQSALEAAAKALNPEIQAISELLIEKFNEQGVESIELESGMGVERKIKPRVSVQSTEEAKLAYAKWLCRPKIRQLFTLNAKTRDAWVLEELSQGRPAPSWAKVYLHEFTKLYGKNKESQNGGTSDEE